MIFFMVAIYPTISQIKSRSIQHSAALRFLLRSMEDQEKNIGSAINQINTLDRKSVFPAAVKDDIEHQYDRAKRILKNGLMDDHDLLDSCDITLEEMELLSGMITNTEKAR